MNCTTDLSWKSDLSPLFSPQSIALIGASENSAWSSSLVQNLNELGYQGNLFPVNPKRETAFGLKCYTSVQEIPESIDAFVIAISRDGILPVLANCAQKNIRSGVIISAGFAEASEQGKNIQQQIVELANANQMRICGPNSFGVANLHARVSLIASSEVRYLKPGKISFIFQSGGLLNAALLAAWDRAWGIGCAISCGNEAVLNIADYLDFLVQDDNTGIIGILTEGFKDPTKFLRAAALAKAAEKPIIILKLGKSEKGKQAAQSHTGTLVGSDEVYEAVFRQHGITRVADLDDFVETIELFSKRKKRTGHRVGVIVPSGAECGLIADLAEDAAVELPELSRDTMERLASGQSEYLSIRNPLNAPERYVRRGTVFREWIETLVADENLDIIGLRLPLPRGREDQDVIARFRDLVEIAGRTQKLVILFSRASISLPEYWRRLIGESPVPFLLEYRKGLKAIRALLDYQRFLDARQDFSSFEIAPSPDREKIKRLLASNDRVFTERQGKEILAAYGIPVTREDLAHSEEEALALAQTIGYPVALKVEARQITHKTDAGAVRTHIVGDEELIRCYREVEHNARIFDPSATIEGILVQKMIPKGKELIIGMTRDPEFGPVILLGLGGVFVEVIHDLSMRIAPLSKLDANEMVRELKGYPILQGVRGEPESDVEAIIEIILRFSRLSLDLVNEITAIDINPLIVLEKGRGAVAVDCLMTRTETDL